MSEFPWFRFYSEALNDPKLKRIVTVTKQPKALINGVWVGLLCLASESPERGKLLISDDMPYLLEEIVDAVGVDFELGELIIGYLIKFNLITLDGDTYTITQWGERQRKSDSSAERVRRHRARQAAKKPDDFNGDGSNSHPKRNCNVTCNVTEKKGNVVESESDIDIESTTTTAHTHAREGQSEFSKIVGLLAQGGLYLDGFTSQLVQDCYNDLSPPPGEDKSSWFEYALEESSGKRRSWKYLEAIIRNVNDNGGLSGHKAARIAQKAKGRSTYADSRPSNVPIGLQDPEHHPKPAPKQVYDPATGKTYWQQ